MTKLATQRKKASALLSDVHLHAAVRTHCLAEYERIFGFRWNDSCASDLFERVGYGEEGREVLEQVLDALEALAAFVAKPDSGETATGVAATRLFAAAKPCCDHWIWSKEYRHVFERGPHGLGRKNKDRARLVKVLDESPQWLRGGFPFPPREDGSTSLLDVSEMAIVSLLAGNWPSVSGEQTVQWVLDREERAIHLAIRRYGQPGERGGPPFDRSDEWHASYEMDRKLVSENADGLTATFSVMVTHKLSAIELAANMTERADLEEQLARDLETQAAEEASWAKKRAEERAKLLAKLQELERQLAGQEHN